MGGKHFMEAMMAFDNDQALIGELQRYVPAKIRQLPHTLLMHMAEPGGLLTRLPQDNDEMRRAKELVIVGTGSLIAARIYRAFAPDALKPEVDRLLIEPTREKIRPNLSILFPESDYADMDKTLDALDTAVSRSIAPHLGAYKN
jgi:hypothetical protein